MFGIKLSDLDPVRAIKGSVAGLVDTGATLWRDGTKWLDENNIVSFNENGFKIGGVTLLEGQTIAPFLDIGPAALAGLDAIGDIGTGIYTGDWGKVKKGVTDLGNAAITIGERFLEGVVKTHLYFLGVKDEEVFLASIVSNPLFELSNTTKLTPTVLEYVSDNNNCAVDMPFSDYMLSHDRKKLALANKARNASTTSKLSDFTKMYIKHTGVVDVAAIEYLQGRFPSYDIHILGGSYKIPTAMELALWQLHIEGVYAYNVRTHSIRNKATNTAIGTLLAAKFTEDDRVEVSVGVLGVETTKLVYEYLRPAEHYLVLTYSSIGTVPAVFDALGLTMDTEGIHVHCLHPSFLVNREVSALFGKQVNIRVFPVIPIRVQGVNVNGVADTTYIKAYNDTMAQQEAQNVYNNNPTEANLITLNNAKAAALSNNLIGKKFIDGTKVVDEDLYGEDTAYRAVDIFLHKIGYTADLLCGMICTAPAETLEQTKDAYLAFEFNPLEDSDAIRKMTFLFVARMHSMSGSNPVSVDPETGSIVDGGTNTVDVQVELSAYTFNSILTYKSVYTNVSDTTTDTTAVGKYTVIKDSANNGFKVSLRHSLSGRFEFHVTDIAKSSMVRGGDKTAKVTFEDVNSETTAGKGQLMLPLIYTFMIGLSPNETEDLMLRSIRIVTYGGQITIVPWYATDNFKDVLNIVGIVITVVATIVGFIAGGPTLATAVYMAVDYAIGELLKFIGQEVAAYLINKEKKATQKLEARMSELQAKLEESLNNRLGSSAEVTTAELVEILTNELNIIFSIEDQYELALGAANYLPPKMYSPDKQFCIDHKLNFMGN